MPPRLGLTTDICDAGVHLLCLQVNVANVDLRSTMLGHGVKMPVYISSCALGRLAHPDGELCLTRAAATCGVVQLWPTLASCTLDEMDQVRTKDQVLFLQLYVNHDRKVCQPLSPLSLSLCVCVCVCCERGQNLFPPTHKCTYSHPLHDACLAAVRQVSERLIARAEERGVRAIFVTVDAPQLGRREKDMRVKFTMESPDVQKSEDSAGKVDRNQV